MLHVLDKLQALKKKKEIELPLPVETLECLLSELRVIKLKTSHTKCNLIKVFLFQQNE